MSMQTVPEIKIDQRIRTEAFLPVYFPALGMDAGGVDFCGCVYQRAPYAIFYGCPQSFAHII